MSGHSKWHNIRVKKQATDAKKGKVYTKYARLIEIAAREGGGDPVKNAKLRSLIDSAKSESVPNANIERAIKKGTGELKGDVMQEVVYETYGPSGTAFIIECLTDNKNRTLSNVKVIIGKNGGNFAESGSVAWMFARKGVVVANGKLTSLRPDGASDGQEMENGKFDAIELQLIEIGAEEIEKEDDMIRVISDMSAWSAIRDALQKTGLKIESAGLEYVPTQTAPVDADGMAKVEKFMDALEEDDDVSTVYTNAEES